MTPAFLGIDVGTSGIRACCIDDSGNRLASSSVTLEPTDNTANQSEQDPEMWWQCVTAVIRSITTALPQVEIKTIAVDGTSGTVFLTDDHGNPLAPALMYNDQRCTQEAEKIAKLAPKDSAVHGASSGLAKLIHRLQQFPQARHLCHPADWISAKLSGEFGISDYNNCLKTGYDPVAQCWPDYMQKLGIGSTLLPKVVAPGTHIGAIQQEVTKLTGLPSTCNVVAGTTDSIAAFIATGASDIGVGVTSLGSSLSLKMICTKPVFSADDGIYSHRLGDLWLVGGASNSGGHVLQQFFNQQQLDAMTPLLQADNPTGLNYYPLAGKGERFPVNDVNLKANMTPRPEDDLIFFQALLEGISRIEKLGYEKLQSLSNTKLTQVLTSGGGSANLPWTQIRQNNLGIPVMQAQHANASYGSALLAKRACCRIT